MLADQKTSYLAMPRSLLTGLVTPLHLAANAPANTWGWLTSVFVKYEDLLEENQQLKNQALQLAQKNLTLASLMAENLRLRELLKAAQALEHNYLTAELIGLNYDPFSQQLILNRGDKTGAYIGQPVIDAAGVMGQIISTSPYTSRLLLISDINHALPVELNRNGLRFIAQGSGNPEEIYLEHLPKTADLKEGDLLITSGLGGRFPYGLPVARIKKITHQTGRPFMKVIAKPEARLNKSRYLLLLEQPALLEEELAQTQQLTTPLLLNSHLLYNQSPEDKKEIH